MSKAVEAIINKYKTKRVGQKTNKVGQGANITNLMEAFVQSFNDVLEDTEILNRRSKNK